MTFAGYANLALRFLLELCALAALGYWGFRTGAGPVGKTALCLGTPLLAAVVWGTLVAPKAPVSLAEPPRLLIELAVFGLSVAALVGAGRPGLALALGLIYAVNRVLMYAWHQ